MKELGVLGGSEFTLGFRLTGIKKVIEWMRNSENLSLYKAGQYNV